MAQASSGQGSGRKRVLRIGILLGGKIVDEKIVHERGNVTVGQSMKNTFSIPIEGLPLEHTMFAIHDGKYALRFSQNMDGRISDGQAVHTLDALKRSAQRDGDYFVLPLSDHARGKLTVGDMSLLFQFVTEPPKQPKPMLPASVRGTLADRIDPRLAACIGGSVLVHFGLVLWAVSTDRIVDDGLAGRAATLTFKPETYAVDIVKPPEPPKEPGSAAGSAAAEKGNEKKPDTQPKKPGGDDGKKPTPDKDPGGGDGRNANDAVALQEEAALMATTLTGGDSGDEDLGAMGQRRPGTELGQEVANAKESGRTVTTGSNGRGSRGNGDPRTGTGKGTGVTGPGGTETVGGGKTTETTPGGRIVVSDKKAYDDSSLTPDAVLGKINSTYMRQLQRCYKSYLAKDATARGKVTLGFTVNESGRLTSPNAKGFAGEVDSCVEGLMAGWTFPVPKDSDGEKTTAQFSVSLQLVPE